MSDPHLELLRQAAALIRQGNAQAASAVLANYLLAHPGAAQAWILLSYAVPERDRKVYCLQRAIRIDPQAEHAQARLRFIQSQASQNIHHPPAVRQANIHAPGEAQSVTVPSLASSAQLPAKGGSHLENFIAWARRLQLSLALAWRRGRDAWRIYTQNRQALFGLILLFTFALMALSHPVLINTVWPKSIYDPKVGIDTSVAPFPSPPSSRHLLGTDVFGRDVLSILLATAGPTFTVAIAAALGTAAISSFSGSFSAYFGGWVDRILGQLTDLALLAPAPLVMVVIGYAFDVSPLQFGLLYGLLEGFGGSAIVMRSQALSTLSQPFIDASRISGAGSLRIIFKHLIPHMLPLSTVQMLLSIVGAVFADGFLSFLGLSRGTKLNWGGMIFDSFSYRQIYGAVPWNVLLPAALCISLFAACFYFISTGVHQVAEPRLRDQI